MFLGTAGHQILAWEPPQPELVSNIQLSDHTGWVRALAQHSHWLYRCFPEAPVNFTAGQRQREKGMSQVRLQSCLEYRQHPHHPRY